MSYFDEIKNYLERIKKQDKYNAFLEIFEQRALNKAEELDERKKRGEKLGNLAGIPVAVKDNILVKGEKFTCGSKILEGFVAPYSATVVEKLEAADAVIIGRTNMDEFAMGSSTENSAYGPTKNPHDLKRVAGGSSGGSAAAVAGDLVPVALGSDTGGSIRQPAAFCGVLGFKPTYGAVSRYGLVAFASSLDQIGVFAKDPDLLESVFDVICGVDEKDETSHKIDTSPKNVAFQRIEGYPKIGVPKEFLNCSQEVREIFEKALKGFNIVEISLPHTEYAVAVYYIVAPSEASSNLARFDGVRYGRRIEGDDLISTYSKTRGHGFGEEVKRRIMIGTFSLSSGYYDAYYLKAQKVRTLIAEDFRDAFKKVDYIVTPTTPTPAFKIGEITDPLSLYLQDVYTIPASLAGLPAISIPAGKTKDGLPVGLQIIGKRNSDFMLLFHDIFYFTGEK